MKRVLLGVFLLAASGCGGENTQTASAPELPPDAPSIPDVTDLDFEDFDDDDASGDTLDTPEADTLEVAASAPAPAFAPFLTTFKVALQNGQTRRFVSEDLSPEVLASINDPAVQQQILAAGADRYRREGTRRDVWVVIGYDMDGNVVPEDEAETESGVGLVFDVVNGEYRLVEIMRAG